MKLTKKQLEFIDKKIKENKRILSYNPSLGWLSLKLENRFLKLLIDIHNAGTDHES